MFVWLDVLFASGAAPAPFDAREDPSARNGMPGRRPDLSEKLSKGRFRGGWDSDEDVTAPAL